MSWIIMSVEKVEGKERIHFHRITAPNMLEALARANALFKGAYKIVAIINAKYEKELG